MNVKSSMARTLHLGLMLVMVFSLASPAMAQYVSRDEATRIARREVVKQLQVSWSDVRVEQVNDDGRGYTVNWSVPGRYGRVRTGWCVVSRRGRIVEFQRNQGQGGRNYDPQVAIRQVQDTVREQVVAEHGGTVVFGTDASTYDVSRGARGVRGTGSLNRRGRNRTFTYSAVYDERSGSVGQVTYKVERGGYAPPDQGPPNQGPPDTGGTPSSVSLRGPNGQFVYAESSTGTIMCRGNRGGEALGLFDHNGGSLQNGDPVSLRSHRGGWLSAENGGGGNLVMGGDSAGPWETFTIIKLDLSSGPAIRSGDRVALRSQGGRFITAENGGGSKLNCKGTSQGPWEVFILEFR